MLRRSVCFSIRRHVAGHVGKVFQVLGAQREAEAGVVGAAGVDPGGGGGGQVRVRRPQRAGDGVLLAADTQRATG